MPWEEDWSLLIGYLDLYAKHASFRDALVELYERHAASAESVLRKPSELWNIHELTWRGDDLGRWAGSYIGAVAKLAREYGLDRLGSYRGRREPGALYASRGEALLHAWVRRRAALTPGRLGEAGPEYFAHVATASGAYPDLGDGKNSGAPVRIQAEAQWDPRRETKAGARRRILGLSTAQLDAELDRIVAESEERGYHFADTRPNVRRDLGWLFEHIALGRSYTQIAASHLYGADQAPSIYNRIKPYADRLRINLAPGPRFSQSARKK